MVFTILIPSMLPVKVKIKEAAPIIIAQNSLIPIGASSISLLLIITLVIQ